MFASNVYSYLNNIIIDGLDLLESNNDIESKELFKFSNIDDKQQRLIEKYNQIKLDMENNEPSLVSDNGSITQVLDLKIFEKSMTFWLSKSQ